MADSDNVVEIGSRTGYLGRRLTASRVPGAKDYRITFHKDNSTKTEMRSKAPVYLLMSTREEAERVMWRVRNLRSHRDEGLTCKLQVFTVAGWKAVDDD